MERRGCVVCGVRGVGTEAGDVAGNRGHEAVVGQVTAEERRTQTGSDGQVVERAAIFARNLMQDRIRQAIALLERSSVLADQGIIDGECFCTKTVQGKQAGFASLAVTTAVIRV